MTLVALVTCAALPELDPDDQLLLAPLAAAGVAVEPAVWDDPAVAWDRYDLAVLRSPWDYTSRRDEFVAWAASVPRLANPAAVVAWNTDKRYLAELAGAGVPTVPTEWLAADDPVNLPTAGEWVLKPAVGAGSLDAGRYRLGDPHERRLAREHVARLQTAGRVIMLQPYLTELDKAGETGLLFVGGEFSHGIRKGPMLGGPHQGSEGLYLPEVIEAGEPTAEEHALAERALAAVPLRPLLYARVDLVPGPGGHPVVMEVELTEPSLFLGTTPGAAERFAQAIVARLGPGAR